MLLIFLLTSTYFLREGPIDDLMKFLPRSMDSKLSALIKMYYAPSVLIKFYDILRCLSCLFFFSGMDNISAPFMPISLSYRRRVSRVLFWSKIAARQRAPSIPNEFFLIEPSYMPRWRVWIWPFLINSSRMSDRPTSLIMLLARLRFSIFVLLIKFLMACIPY